MHTNSLPTCIHNLGVNLLKRWKINHSRNHTLYKRKNQIEAHLVIWWQTVQNQKRRQNQIVDKLNPIVDMMSLHTHTHWYLFVYRVKEWLHNIFEVTLVKKSSVSSVPWQLDGAFLCELVKYHRRECAMWFGWRVPLPGNTWMESEVDQLWGCAESFLARHWVTVTPVLAAVGGSNQLYIEVKSLVEAVSASSFLIHWWK